MVGIALPDELFRHDYNSGFSKKLNKDLVVATTTDYQAADEATKVRSALALSMLSKAIAQGYRVVAVDGGSEDGWLHEVRALGVDVIPEDSNRQGKHPMGKSRRQALEEAGNCQGAKIIAWIEPEKAGFLMNGKRNPMEYAAFPVHSLECEVAIPRRLDNLASYPLQQALLEIGANLTYQEVLRDRLGEDAPYFDMQFGPRIISRDSLDTFLSYTGELRTPHDKWESIFVPVWDLMLQGRKIFSVPVHYAHPPEQTQLEQADHNYATKRVDQLAALKDALEELLEL
ncbi:MAG: hypothetical protein EPN86_01745 [Nanoarchaeota archaeon]|nr:MAG: hypothetical protein EPN86_01745 [Nanoarchaeota archaeon]